MRTESPSVDDRVAELYREHRLALIRLAVFLIDDRFVAEEIVQDAFAALYQRWGSLADTRAAFGYLRTSVVNGARSLHRRRGLIRRHLRVAEPEATPDADYALMLAEEHSEVIAGLRELPRRQREVLVLRYWAELNEAEIAATLGVSRGTVKSTASRGLAALQRLLEPASEETR